jgi:hypothetical protein
LLRLALESNHHEAPLSLSFELKQRVQGFFDLEASKVIDATCPDETTLLHDYYASAHQLFDVLIRIGGDSGHSDLDGWSVERVSISESTGMLDRQRLLTWSVSKNEGFSPYALFPSPQSALAIVFQDSFKESHELRIFDGVSRNHGFTANEEARVCFSTRILAVSWLPLWNGLNSFAIMTAESPIIQFFRQECMFGQQSNSISQAFHRWILVGSTMMVEPDISIHDISPFLATTPVQHGHLVALQSGHLLIPQGHHLIFNTKWSLTTDSQRSSLYSVLHDVSTPSLEEQLYNPSFLLELALLDRFPLMNAILQSFHDRLFSYGSLSTHLEGLSLINRILNLLDENRTKARLEAHQDQDWDITESTKSYANFLKDTLFDYTSLSRELHDAWNTDQQKLFTKSRIPQYEVLLRAMGDYRTKVRQISCPSVDVYGHRFLIEFSVFLQEMSPLQASVSSSRCLGSRAITWALHSNSQNFLLEFCLEKISENRRFTWDVARSLGICFWLRDIDALRTCTETIARNHFLGGNAMMDARDPVSCSFFYLALNKKKLLQNVWKVCREHPEHELMTRFLSNDFSEAHWQQAALKNAYVLLSKRRFLYAASFFILACRVNDAIQVCLRQLNDFSLAFLLARLYDQGDPSANGRDRYPIALPGPLGCQLIDNVLLPQCLHMQDHWMAHVGFWLKGNVKSAFRVLVEPLEAHIMLPDSFRRLPFGLVNVSGEKSSGDVSLLSTLSDSCLLMFLIDLREHALIRSASSGLSKNEGIWLMKFGETIKQLLARHQSFIGFIMVDAISKNQKLDEMAEKVEQDIRFCLMTQLMAVRFPQHVNRILS